MLCFSYCKASADEIILPQLALMLVSGGAEITSEVDLLREDRHTEEALRTSTELLFGPGSGQWSGVLDAGYPSVVKVLDVIAVAD